MNNKSVYELVKEFKKRYPWTVAWRLKKHSKVIQKHLNDDEKILYAFCGQKNDKWYNMITSSVIVITDKRIMTAIDRVVYGYFLTSITPDMFNDLSVYSGLLWGRIIIDTIDEEVVISNLSKKSLDEIETNITKYIIREKKKFKKENK